MIRIPRGPGVALARLRALRAAATLAVCGGLLLSVACGRWREASSHSESGSPEAKRRPVAGLVEVAGAGRFTEPWLSAFSAYRPCGGDGAAGEDGTAAGEGGSGAERAPGDCPDRPALPRDALSAWGRTLVGTEASDPAADPDRLHARGLWYLLFPDRRSEAVTFLRAARDRVPADWRLHNDLAAAALLDALDGEPFDLLLALSEADAAVRAAPKALAPRFNTALILERLGLEEDAVQAWRDFLALKPPAGWREEATVRLARLGRRAVDRSSVDDALRAALASADDGRLAALVGLHPEDAWQLGVEEVLPEWARRTVADANGPGTAEALRAVHRLGAALAPATGDRFLLAVAERVAALPVPERRRLATACLRLEEAETAYAARRIADARSALVAARRAVHDLPSPLDPWIEYRLQLCAYWNGDGGVAAALDALRARVAERSDPILDGYLLWTAGLVRIDDGRFAAGRSLYRQAIERFTGARLAGEVAILHTLLSDVELRLGAVPRAWAEALAATSASHALRKPRRRAAAWDQAARIALLTSHGDAALRFQDAAVRAAEAASPSTKSAAFASRARVRIETGDLAGAREDLVEAQKWSEEIAEAPVRARAEASILLAQQLVDGAGDITAQVERLDQAVDRFRRIGASVLVPELLVERAHLLATAGRQGQAESDLLEGLAAMDDEAEHLDRLEERVSFSTTARQAIEALLAGALAPDGDPGPVPVLTDLARDPLSGADRILGSDVARALRLAPEDAFLSVTVLPDRLVLWSAHGGRLAVATEPVDAREIHRRLRAIAAEPTRADLGWFYDRMVRPLQGSLEGAGRLFVALDRGLYLVPVAALFDRVTGRFLVERTAVSIVPSAARFAARRTPRGGGAPAPARLTILAAAESGDLPSLPQVDGEAADLTALYPEVHTLSAPDSARALERAAAHADVLHVATHAVSNSIDPGLSLLATAAEPIYARDIRKLDLRRVRTVVLAACDTAATSPRDSTGALSLASAFLEAGASWVVGSTRPVDDLAARRVVEPLHRALRSGLPPDQALRKVQMHYARSDELPLREWAAFEVFNG